MSFFFCSNCNWLYTECKCKLYCTTETGIDYTTEYDLADLSRENMFETVEKELVICETCGGVVGRKDEL